MTKEYYKQALKEMLQDGVQYLELRVLLPPVYDLDGKIYSYVERIQLYVDGLNEFKAEHPDFIGSKFIFAPLKAVPEQTISEYIDIMTDLQRKFPEYIAGFDLVGQEDKAPYLVDLAEKLLQIPEDIQFFYHAGETNWFGSIDENLVDAIMLGSKRIGHGYALSKHPLLLKMVKERGIAVEINPISNQVLKLVDDIRNHPAAVYFSQNIPLIISSDDPSFWGASPLSHDFYMAFLGIASKRSDLRTLKKLATNSIKYSSLNKQEKEIAFSKWQAKWDRFIEEVIAES
ncbi:Adenosine deaminase 2, partial [Pseudolycoriella hygida]